APAAKKGKSALPTPLLRFPALPLADPKQDLLVLPLHEGLVVPASDLSLLDYGRDFTFFGWPPGGLVMPWVGVTDMGRAMMALVETPYDAGLRLQSAEADGAQAVFPVIQWFPSLGRLNTPRVLRLRFFDHGDYVTLAKHYREAARRQGLLRTLEEKARERPAVNLLQGAPDIWLWFEGTRNTEFVDRLKSLGIRRALVGTEPYHPPEVTSELIERIKADGYLAAWYMNYKSLKGFQSYAASLDWMIGQTREEENRLHYSAKFLDTVTAQAALEYPKADPPQTREDDVQARLRLLQASQAEGLVVGSENGAFWAVPGLDYIEGMMSMVSEFAKYKKDEPPPPGFYKAWEANVMLPLEPSAKYLEFAVNERIRAPLWELVFHDCVVSTWHWHDNSQKMNGLWDKRDLFNILYGTAPMWMLTRPTWDENEERFLKCYRDVCGGHEKIAFAEMIGHRALTPDRSVQESRFSNGWRVVVNFGDKPHENKGESVAPMGYRTWQDTP
ncbi:MAG: hypothetical protein NTW86_18365, partial [Candidatus Sumerlaeota bacterium]|nr:hypothetical protein [Candidatus Sumerlaeota bacterium]